MRTLKHRFRIVAPKTSYEASKQPPSAGVETGVSSSSEVAITAPDKQPDRKEQQQFLLTFVLL